VEAAASTGSRSVAVPTNATTAGTVGSGCWVGTSSGAGISARALAMWSAWVSTASRIDVALSAVVVAHVAVPASCS